MTGVYEWNYDRRSQWLSRMLGESTQDVYGVGDGKRRKDRSREVQSAESSYPSPFSPIIHCCFGFISSRVKNSTNPFALSVSWSVTRGVLLGRLQDLGGGTKHQTWSRDVVRRVVTKVIHDAVVMVSDGERAQGGNFSSREEVNHVFASDEDRWRLCPPKGSWTWISGVY